MTTLMIGRTVRDARKSAGLKQTALQAQLGLRSTSFLPQVEHGKIVPSLDMAAKLEKALAIPPHSIASLVIKYRLQEQTAMLMHEAQERGIDVQVRLMFTERRKR